MEKQDPSKSFDRYLREWTQKASTGQEEEQVVLIAKRVCKWYQ